LAKQRVRDEEIVFDSCDVVSCSGGG